MIGASSVTVAAAGAKPSARASSQTNGRTASIRNVPSAPDRTLATGVRGRPAA